MPPDISSVPAVEGISQFTLWVTLLLLTNIAEIVGAVWSEFQRRSERKDKKESEKTVAEVSSSQRHLELSYQAVKEALERQDVLIDKLNDQLTLMKAEYMKVLEELRQERAESKNLHNENSELRIKVSTLESRIAQLERDTKSLEESRDKALRGCQK
jgi:chromosome segregation ATPase